MVTNNGHTGKPKIVAWEMWLIFLSIFLFYFFNFNIIAQFSLEGTSNVELPYITGGGLNDRFIFQQMHFHWGLDSTRGSEHTINGQA